MDKHAAPEPTAAEEAELEAAITELLAEISRANEQMSRDQQEIEHLKAETRTILARLAA